jgi:hypothetical protein
MTPPLPVKLSARVLSPAILVFQNIISVWLVHSDGYVKREGCDIPDV